MRAGTQVSTGHAGEGTAHRCTQVSAGEGRDTGEYRAHKCAQMRAGTQVSTGHTGLHR